MKIENILSQLGFSENEIEIYLATLDLSSASAQEIAKQAGLPRTTAYSILRRLVRRGLVGKTVKRSKTRFVAEDPKKLQGLIDTLNTELQSKMQDLDARYRGKSSKPRVTIYEGSDAIGKVFSDTLHSKPKEILEWNTNEFFKYDQYKIDRNYIKKRVAKGIHAKRIASKESGWDTKHKKRDEQELSQTLTIPGNLFDPAIEVNIYNNKVAFINYTESMSMIIESKPIADAMKQVYELTWRQAKNMDNKK